MIKTVVCRGENFRRPIEFYCDPQTGALMAWETNLAVI